MKSFLPAVRPQLSFRAVVVFCCLIISVTVCSKDIQAVNELRVATWNMQGAQPRGGPSRWGYEIQEMQVNNAYPQVLALQESGSIAHLLQLPCIDERPAPGSANGVPLDTGGYGLPAHFRVSELEWSVGTRRNRQTRFIYHADHANRVNVAIVTNILADRVIILPATIAYHAARPILGIQRGNNFYFSVHAIASGEVASRRDAARIIDRITTYMQNTQQNNPNAQWMILGDFNTTPDDLQAELNTNYPNIMNSIRLYYPRHPTHQGGRLIDYAVVGSIAGGASIVNQFSAAVDHMVESDHYLVRFSPR